MHRAFALVLILATAGCSTTWESMDSPTLVANNADFEMFQRDNPWDSELAPADAPIVEGQWRELPPEEETVETVVVVEQPKPVPQPVVVQPKPAPQHTLPIPERRTQKKKLKKGETRDLDELAREHFIRNPTHIRAERVSVICPPSYRRQMRLRADFVEDGVGNAREATGNATLYLRELFIEADQITVRSVEADKIQILARGGVAFVSRVGERVMREEGLRSMIITNDRTLPLR